MTSSTSNVGIPGQANHKQKKEKPKTKKEIENEKKRSKIQKQIDESEEEKVNQPIRTDPSPANSLPDLIRPKLTGPDPKPKTHQNLPGWPNPYLTQFRT